MIKVWLPYPPSVNRLWRHVGKRVYRDPSYVKWLAEAGWLVKSTGAHLQPIAGPFELKLVLRPPDKRWRDPDNLIKPVLDLLQATGVIENDRFCYKGSWSLVLNSSSPSGVDLTLSPMTD